MKRKILMTAGVLSTLYIYGEGPVTRNDAPHGVLDGRTVAVWQSHGRYWEEKEQRWEWQRARLFGTVEDIFTRSYVVPYLVPMLENAGAYVVMPRERDANTFELIVDNSSPGYIETNPTHAKSKNKWKDATTPGYAIPAHPLKQGQNPFTAGNARTVNATGDPKHIAIAKWDGTISEAGEYAVYLAYESSPESCPEVHYTIHTATGTVEVTVNQRMGGNTWTYAGTFPFKDGKQTLVSLTSESDKDGHISADAIRIGGGMGTVARGADDETSGMPRWTEAARYWLQYAGFPESVYSPEESDGTDYRDDIYCRPLWVNYLRDKMNIPVELVMAFHSDAGTEKGDTTVGTMGIYYTNRNRDKYPDGKSKKLGGQLADSIVTSVVRDIQTLYDPNWTRRKMRDKSYIEARIPDAPTMLLELLSHQNLTDMTYGLDPQFKFDVSRAVYKGILRFFASQGKAKYIVEPLAVNSFEIRHTLQPTEFLLQWEPTDDPLEPTAFPVSYRVEERVGGLDEPFRTIAETHVPCYSATVTPGQVYSYRIVAVNSGGRSFPSETLAVGVVPGAKERVTVVNGFTRVSGPDWWTEGDMGGVGLLDPGVPDGVDLSYVGEQTEFHRSAEWQDDDAPGFGGSRANMEGKPVWGNSRDYTAVHGAAIMAAGQSFTSYSLKAFCADTLSAPSTVDLILGLQKTTKVGVANRAAEFQTFPPELQQRLRQTASMGTAIMISGSYVGADLQSSDAVSFAAEVLGYRWRDRNVRVEGTVNEVRSQYLQWFTGGCFTFSTELGEKPYAVTAPDAIIPAGPDAATIMRYNENSYPAAVAFAPYGHKAVTLGFPFESINSTAGRYKLMKQILNFLK